MVHLLDNIDHVKVWYI